MSTASKDQVAFFVVEAKFVSKTREDHNAKIVVEVRFVSTTR